MRSRVARRLAAAGLAPQWATGVQARVALRRGALRVLLVLLLLGWPAVGSAPAGASGGTTPTASAARAARAAPAAPAAPSAPTATPLARSVVVVGVPGLRWDDVSATGTHALWRLAASGSTGALSVKAGPAGATCPADGWLTLGAGNRAAAADRTAGAAAAAGTLRSGGAGPSTRCPGPLLGVAPVTAAAGGPAVVPGFRALGAANRRRDRDVRLGALTAVLLKHGRCTAAAGPGAALAAADPTGRLTAYTPARPDRAFLTRCPLTVVALPAVHGPTGPARRRAASAADSALSAVDSARSPGSLLLVTGIGTDTDVPRLQVALANGPGFPAGRLVSASTRRPPYVQLVDLLPTVLGVLGVPPPAGVIGEPWRRTGGLAATVADNVAGLRDLDRAAGAQRRLAVPFVVIFVGLQAVVYGLAWNAYRRGHQARARRVTYATAVAAAAAPGASFLASLLPWARAPAPVAALAGAIVLTGALLVVLALSAGRVIQGTLVRGQGEQLALDHHGGGRAHLGPPEPGAHAAPLGPAGTLAVLTFALLIADLVTGAHLQIDSVAGYSPLVAGRFAGIGNLAFGVLGASALLSAAVLAAGRSRRTALAVVAAVGLGAVIVDGAPPFGSDVGGVLALVPAFAVLGMLLVNGRVSWRPLLLAVLAGAAAVAGFGLLDYARAPSQQTHLGRFVGQVLHGGAGDVVRRKAETNLQLLTANALTLVVPAVFALVAVLLLRPPAALLRAYERAPVLRPALLATLVLIVVGFAVNDSGVAVAGMAMAVAIPVTVAVCVAAARDTPPPAEAPPPG